MEQGITIYSTKVAKKRTEEEKMDVYLEQLTELHQLRRRMNDLKRDRLLAETEAFAVRAACRKEIRGLAAFVGVGACAVAMTVCMLAAPWWTAVAPLLLALGVLRRIGW